MNHAELCDRGTRWMKNTFHCRTVLVEPHACGTYAGETPDVIGWVGGKCIVVECKVSRADFLRDQKKFFRSPELAENALGNWRFYLTLPGVVKESDQLLPGWGVYEVCGKTVRHRYGRDYRNAMQPPFMFGISGLRSEVSILLYAFDKMNDAKEVLSEAVELYGKPGGPWNIPGDPGGWISRARKALEMEE